MKDEMPKLIPWYDIEGGPVWLTPQEYEKRMLSQQRLREYFESLTPPDLKAKGKILITTTTVDNKDGEFFKNVWPSSAEWVKRMKDDDERIRKSGLVTYFKPHQGSGFDQFGAPLPEEKGFDGILPTIKEGIERGESLPEKKEVTMDDIEAWIADYYKKPEENEK